MSECCSSCSTARICPDGQRYVAKQMALPPKKAVIACEGACIKGEVARTAANRLAYRLQAGNAVRICLGDAATGDSGMAELVKRAPEVIAIEGCPLHCGLTVLKSRIPDLKATVIDASKLYSFDREANFEIFDLPREQIENFAGIVANHAAKNASLTGVSEMGCNSCQPTDKINRVVYGCAGCADVGFVADDVSRKLRRDGFASPKASCLAGIGAGIQPFIEAAKAADMVITVDGCEVGCARKVIENTGLTPKSFVLTRMGLTKGETTPSPELTGRLCLEIAGSTD